MTKSIFSGLLVALSTTACSSSYVPANSPRIATVWDGGYASYYRDGEAYPSGLLMGGVEDVVHGNPRAEEEARTAHHLMIGGLVCTIAGAGALGSGIALAASNPTGSTGSDVGLGLTIGSIAANVAAAILFASAYPHAYDAVNIYNDGVDAAWAHPPPPAVPVLTEPPSTR
jgi:hypothetical protein